MSERNKTGGKESRASGRRARTVFVKVIRKDSPEAGRILRVLSDGFDPYFMQHLTTVKSGRLRLKLPTSWLQVVPPPERGRKQA